MSPTIRQFVDTDRVRCCELWRSLTQRHRDLYDDPTLGGPDPGVEFDEYLRQPELHGLWVAEHAHQVVGLCGLLIRGEECELEPIVVDPSHRSRGVGALLAQQAIAESRHLGMKYVNVRPVARNLEAIRFFHRQGFQLLGRFELSIALEGASPFGSTRATELHGLRFEY